MKKKALIAMALVLVLSVSAGVIAFAEDTGPVDKSRNHEQREVRIERAIKAYIRLRHLLNEYYPEGVDELEAAKEAHSTFHEEAREDRREMADAIREEREEIKESFENGEIDRVEAGKQAAELRTNMMAMRTEIKVAADEKRIAQNEIRERLVEIREDIRQNLSQDETNPETVKGLLIETLGLMGMHLENDLNYHEVFYEISSRYGY